MTSVEGARSAAASSSEVPPQGAEADDLSRPNILITVTDTADEAEASSLLLAVRMDGGTQNRGSTVLQNLRVCTKHVLCSRGFLVQS